MNKIVASVGLVALGASALQSASAQSLGSPDTSKPWSVSATLRGFYDDNTGTVPNDATVANRDSFGFEVVPTAAFVWALEQTTINLGFLYSLKYYDHIPPGSTSHSDQTFTFNGGIKHTFSERLKVSVSDSFVIGQEPDMLRAEGDPLATFQRISGDNIRNYGSIAGDAQLTPNWGVGVGYDNAFYDYKASGVGFTTIAPFTGAVVPSPAGTLDRIENRAHFEALWQIQPQTKLILGYQFADVNYTGDELVGGQFNSLLNVWTTPLVFSSDRNYREHTFYAGAQHNFSPQLNGSLRIGGSYIDYYNSWTTSGNWSPYLNASLRYAYAPESYAELGVSYDNSATDIIGLNPADGTFTLSTEAAVVYVSIYHRILPRLFGSLMAQFQNSLYKDGLYDSQSEQFYMVGLNVEYRFTPNFAASVGYNYDRLDSPNVAAGNRSFDRNRVYIGVTASY
jgi:hypothetical protein